jgi:hypothetical protein
MVLCRTGEDSEVQESKHSVELLQCISEVALLLILYFFLIPRKLSYVEEHGLFNYGVHLQIF